MQSLFDNLRAVVGRENVLTERDELLVYECDGLTQHKHLPRAVVFPSSTEEVAAVVREAGCGVLVDSADPGAVAGAIAALGEASRRAAMGEAGRQAALGRFG